MLPGSIDPTAIAAAARAAVPEAEAAAREVAPQARAGIGASPGEGFAELIGQVVEEANGQLVEAENQAGELAAGRGDIVETLLAVSRADLSLRFVVSLRNRALDAYNEIMRLQV